MKNLRELCFTQFGVFHSGITATPLLVGEHLTAALVKAGEAVERNDVFHAEQSLPANERAELSNYRSSGYDRGHMAPAADMASIKAQNESFSLANMVPQDPSLNRGPWADIEDTARKLARQYGEVYMVTGPAFEGKNLSRIGGRVFVPTSTFKAIYIPSANKASAWYAGNGNGKMEVISINDLESRIGIDVFPALPVDVKAQVVALPTPDGVVGRRKPASQDVNSGSTSDSAVSSHRRKTSDEDLSWGRLLFSIAKELLK